MSEPNEKKQGQAFIEKRPKKDKNYRLKQLTSTRGIVVVVSVVFGLFLVAYLYGEFTPIGSNTSNCNDEKIIIREVHEKIIGEGITGNVDEDTGGLLSKKEIESSPNCLFVLSEYYASIYDTEEAEFYYLLFVEANSDDFSADLFSSIHQDPSEYLRIKIDYAKLQSQQIQDGFNVIGEEN